jgi:hypothetical protein
MYKCPSNITEYKFEIWIYCPKKYTINPGIVRIFKSKRVEMELWLEQEISVEYLWENKLDCNYIEIQQDTGRQKWFYRGHTVELDYHVMTYAQKTIFVYGRNGRVNILLQQLWERNNLVHCLQLVSTLEWLLRGLRTPHSCFPFTSPPTRRFMTSHSTRAIVFFFIGTTAPVGLGLPPWNSPFHFGFFFCIIDSR